MFNNRKYVFETKETRTFRRLKTIFFMGMSLFLVYSITCFILLLTAKQESQKSRELYFNRSPDIIIVFTGQSGRIPFAIKMAKKMKQNNILISGVNTKNNVERILKNIDKSEIDPHFLELDYNAKNTIENVKHTLEYLRDSNVLNEVLIISHDYHILRIKAIFTDMMKSEDKFNIHYLSVNSNLLKMKDLKIIYKEVFKFFRTLAYLVIKDID